MLLNRAKASIKTGERFKDKQNNEVMTSFHIHMWMYFSVQTKIQCKLIPILYFILLISGTRVTFMIWRMLSLVFSFNSHNSFWKKYCSHIADEKTAREQFNQEHTASGPLEL